MHLFGIVGNPVFHSKSPLIHNAWFKEAQLHGIYQYVPVENQADLPDILKILPKIGYSGINITVPYKNLAFEILKNDGFTIDEEAESLRAVNTVDFTNKYATNTDPYGFWQLFQPKDEHILVVGAGGVASSVVSACSNANIAGANITITNRTLHKAQEIAEAFFCDVFTGDISKLNLANFDVIINATSVGLGGEVLPLNYDSITKNTLCIDTIYNPKITPFLENAQKKGCRVQNGTMMLIHQGAKSFEIWTKTKPNIQKAKQIMKEFIL